MALAMAFPLRALMLVMLVLPTASQYSTSESWESSTSAQYPDVAQEGVEHVLDFLKSKTDEEIKQQSPYTPSPPEWRAGIVYSVMVDRFNNGDLKNDNLNLPKAQAEGRLSELPNYRMGGDIAGITSRLPYLKSLGINTLWITPIHKHDGSYHGYCTTNPMEVDPGFGTLDEYKDLVKKAHANKIRIVQDIVINHLCDDTMKYTKSPSHIYCCQDLITSYWKNQTVENSNQGELDMGSTFPPLRDPRFFSRCGANSGADTSGIEPCAVFGDFTASMFDYNTGEFDFQRIFTSIFKYWIAATDIDGFRLDAAKHVTEDFLAYFSTEIRDFAKQIGKQDFYIIGEVAAPADWEGRRLGNMMFDPTDPTKHDANLANQQVVRVEELKPTYLAQSKQQFPGLTAIYEFAYSGTSRDALLGGRPMKDIETYCSSNAYNTIAGQSDYSNNWILLEIHDWPRFLFTDPADTQKVAVGLAFLFVSPGIPIIYYGLEQGFNGRCDSISPNTGDPTADSAIRQLCDADIPDSQDAMKRQCMFEGCGWRLGASTSGANAQSFIGKWTPKVTGLEDLFLNKTTTLFQQAQKLIRIRNSCRPLQYGQWFFRYSGTERGDLLVMSRTAVAQEVVVIMNTNSFESKQLPPLLVVDNEINYANDVYISAMDSTVSMKVTGKRTMFLSTGSLSIAPNHYHIMIRKKNSKWNPNYNITLCAK